MNTLIPAISSLSDAAFVQEIQTKLDQKTKPLGALGQLESLAITLAHVLGDLSPVLQQPQLVVFAADHGLAARGVSAYPQDVSWQMVENFLAGGAAVSVLARLGNHDIALCTGAGTGLDAAAVARKAEVLRGVLELHAQAQTPLDALAALGGLEIATMVGAILEAASARRVIVVDGFIASSAVLVACALQPAVRERCVFAHCSGERGHALMLQDLQAAPILNLGLRLGEGSGAALAWPLLASAAAILRDMASFAAAGVSEADPASP